jgi:hypothetical protein
MVKKFKKLLAGIFNKYSPTIKCAVEETGKNSVKPSITPKIIASKFSTITYGY